MAEALTRVSAGIAEKSFRKARKTYISSLIDAGGYINEIRKQVGHEDERTTYRNYCFNRMPQNETENMLEKRRFLRTKRSKVQKSVINCNQKKQNREIAETLYLSVFPLH